MKKRSLKTRILSLFIAFAMIFATVSGASLVHPVVSFAATGKTAVIDYTAETITFNDTTHEMNTSKDWSGTNITSGSSISAYINSSKETPVTLYLREKANATITDVAIPVRPAAPTDGASRTVYGYLKRIETAKNSVKSGEEYSIDNWASKNENGQFTGLENNEEYIVKYRTKATATAFASESADMPAKRTKVQVNYPLFPGNGNTIIINPNYITDGVAVGFGMRFDAYFDKDRRPTLKIKQRPGVEVIYATQPAHGQWTYQHRISEEDKELTFEMTIVDKNLQAVNGGTEYKFADNPENTSAEGIVQLGNNQIPLPAIYNNGTTGWEPVTFKWKSGNFNQKGGVYEIQSTSVLNYPSWLPTISSPNFDWPGVELTIRPVTANVPATLTDKDIPIRTSGYSSHTEIGLPDKITVTYTGQDYTRRSEEVDCTWSPAVGTFGTSAGSQVFTATPNIPSWATDGTVTTTTATVTANASVSTMTYTVSYNANGGTGGPTADSKESGVDLTLSSTEPTRRGYTFKNWNSKSDGSGTVYAPGATYSTDAVTTLYAQWERPFTAVKRIIGLPSKTAINTPVTLKGQTEPASATNKNITWSMKNPGTTGATITKNTFKATAPGIATLTATIANGTSASVDYTQDFTITVERPFEPVMSITGVPTEAIVNQPLSLTGSVVPTDATNSTIIWTVKNAGTTGAAIAGDVFTASAEGTAQVTATVTDGTAAVPATPYTKNFTITVGSKPAAVKFTKLTANGDASTTTTELTATLNASVPDLTLTDFTVEGAVAASLDASKAPVYKLAVSDITVGNGQEVTVTVAKKGYTFTPDNQKTTVNKILTGTVSITGDLKYGGELTAVAQGTNNTSDLVYTWKRGTVNIGTGNKYVIEAEDVGEKLTCEVTSPSEGGLISGVTGTIPKPPSITFPDVKPEDWYYKPVDYVTSYGIMTGYQGGSFGPADSLGRGQFATILYRMAGSPNTSFENMFSDVPAGTFYSLPAVWANKNKIITGYEGGTFGPSDSMTREQLATMLYRYTSVTGGDVSERKNLDGYPDAKKVSSFAREAMSWAVATGLISGDQGDLNPQGISSRAVTATVIQRLQTKK